MSNSILPKKSVRSWIDGRRSMRTNLGQIEVLPLLDLHSSQRHLIPSLRSCSAGSRRQFTTTCMLVIGERQRLQMSNAFPRLFHHAQFVADDNWHVMQSCLTELEISKEELEKQASFMKRFYSNPPDEEPKSVYYDDEICEILLCREVLLEHIEELLNGGVLPPPNFWKELRERLAAKVNGRIPPNAQHPSLLDQKLNKLFDLAEPISVSIGHAHLKRPERALKRVAIYFFFAHHRNIPPPNFQGQVMQFACHENVAKMRVK